MTYRELVAGDRVKIIGHWTNNPTFGSVGGSKNLVDRIATVISVSPVGEMCISILIDNSRYSWCRENLRALPRPK